MNDSLQNMAKFLVKATGAVYSECTTQLLPTPSKSHYVFNLRDFGRVVQGMMQMNNDAFNLVTFVDNMSSSEKSKISSINMPRTLFYFFDLFFFDLFFFDIFL